MPILLLIVAVLLSACSGDNHGHSRKHVGMSSTKGDPHKQIAGPWVPSEVYKWELVLGSNRLLLSLDEEDFMNFRRAFFKGVFDPNSVMNDFEMMKFGKEFCTQSDNPKNIGEARFARSVTMAPQLLTMRDQYGQTAAHWIAQRGRVELIKYLPRN